MAGVIPVAAAAFTLMRMSRFNEMTALLAAGVPLLRVAAPVIVAAVALNVVLGPLNQELVVPRLAPLMTLNRQEAAAGDRGAYAVRAMPLAGGGMFDAARFTPGSADGARPATARGVTVVGRDDAGRIALLAADAAEWDATLRRWRLAGGRRASGLAADPDAARPAVVRPPESEAVESWFAPGAAPADVELHRAAVASVGVGAATSTCSAPANSTPCSPAPAGPPPRSCCGPSTRGSARTR